MPETQAAIQIDGLTKAYGMKTVLRDLNVSIFEGEAIALMGPNGAGKTTLLRCIAATVRPNSGKIRCFGADMQDPSHRGVLGIVGHESRLYPGLTLHENLRFAARMHSVPDVDHRAAEWLREFGLEHHADHMPRQVSRGMRQRAALARACIHNPRILLLDEPFTGLDSQGRESLVDLFGEVKQQRRTLCFATHDASAAETLADRILVIEMGRLRQDRHLAADSIVPVTPSKAA